MFARTPVQSPLWRIFAIGSIALVAPILLIGYSRIEWFRSALAAIALLGLAGYAFGFRVGPRLFWAGFAICFSAVLMFKLGAYASPTLRNLPDLPPNGPGHPITLAVAFVLFTLVSLGLFRLSGWLKTPASAEGGPKPLFRLTSRAEKWTEVSRVAAEARAEMERPMCPAMEAEARSFGAARQLTLKQNQRIGTFAFGATFLAQAALTIFHGGLAAIFWPAITLAVAGAISTYHSAEVVLKTLPKLARSAKATAVLVGLIAIAFLPKYALPLWFARVIMLDLTALMIGDLLITSVHFLNRRR